MLNQAFGIKIAYRFEKKEKKENTRDRLVPDGSDNNSFPKKIPTQNIKES